MSRLLFTVVKQLGDYFPEFELYFKTHYEFVVETSLTPTISPGGDIDFEEDIRIRRKDIDREVKLDYYAKDLIMYGEIYDEE